MMARQVQERTKAAGAYKVHARGCSGGRCRCGGSWVGCGSTSATWTPGSPERPPAVPPQGVTRW